MEGGPSDLCLGNMIETSCNAMKAKRISWGGGLKMIEASLRCLRFFFFRGRELWHQRIAAIIFVRNFMGNFRSPDGCTNLCWCISRQHLDRGPDIKFMSKGPYR